MHSELIDSFGRKIDYLRLSVIEKCNFNCFYCKPDGKSCHSTASDRLSPEQIGRLASAFARLGVSRVRITGGEPLLRRDLAEIVGNISAIDGVDDVSLSTNGHLLPGAMNSLVDAGLNRINISLDSLSADSFARITGQQRQVFTRVMAGVVAAVDAGLSPIKVNMVVLRGVNDQEIPAMVEFARENNINLRFIETMPLGRNGTGLMDYHLPAREILERIRQHFGQELLPVHNVQGGGPARYYSMAGSDATLGVISAVSRHFCETCNRLRVNASGDLQLCLGHADRIPMAHLLEPGIGETELCDAIQAAVLNKPLSHSFSDAKSGHLGVEMAGIGG